MATGSASTLVTATMQMTGEVTQSFILDQIVQSPLGDLAIFVYIISAVGFLLSVALFQNYKMGLWLVLGPALWSITSNTRTEEVNVSWKYAGQVVKDQEYLYNFTNTSIADRTMDSGPATLYVMWDSIVSGAVQNLTGMIATVSNDPATRLFAKTTIQEGLLSTVVKDPDVKEAIKIAMGPQCTPMVQGGLNSTPGAWGPMQAIELETALVNRTLIDVPEGVVRKLCRLKVVHDGWSTSSFESFADLFNSYEASACETIPWSFLTVAGNPLANCYDFSQAVWQAIEVEAEKSLRENFAIVGGDANGNSELGGSLLPDWSLEMLAQDPSAMRRLTATYAVRNEIDSLMYLTKPESLSGSAGDDKNSSAAAIVGFFEKESAQAQAIFFFEAVPYIQGALLYFLAIAYPFVCIMMIIPGFHTSMLTWMGAWAWVKSWDVMFYVVSQLSAIMSENLIHKGMLHSNLKLNEVVSQNGSVTDFPSAVVDRLQYINTIHAAVYSLLDGMNPDFSAGIINYILAVTTISIPALTGMFFLWGRAGTLQFMSDAVKNKSAEAADRVRAQAQDTVLRDIDLKKQIDVRTGQLTAAAFGSGLGFMMGGLPGAFMGGMGAKAIGNSLSGIDVGIKQGGNAAMWGGRAGVIGAGDILDPIDMTKTAFESSFLMQNFQNFTRIDPAAPEKIGD